MGDLKNAAPSANPIFTAAMRRCLLHATFALVLTAVSLCFLATPTSRASHEWTRHYQQHSCPSTPTPFPASFWYVKTHKTGSSTLAGVFRNICAHYWITTVRRDLLYAAQGDTVQPKGKDDANMTQVAAAIHLAKNASESNAVAVVNHLMLTDTKLALLQPRFLFSSVRHPLTRIYSHFVDNLCWRNRGMHEYDVCWFFNATSPFGEKVMAQDTVENRWAYVKQYPQNQSFKYMRGNASTVEEALDQYDFVFVAERMDESLVAFMLMYGLTFQDIVHLRSKDKGGGYKTAADMPQAMNTFIEQNNQLDIQLWELANARLDAAISGLQQKCRAGGFEHALATFKALQRSVKDACSNYVAWHEEHGVPGPYAYVADNGLGYRCAQHQARLFLNSYAK